MDMETTDSYKKLARPFELLEINPEAKTLTQLYRELNFRAREEYLEHCYRSKKNYSPAMFRKTIFYQRFVFLKRHLRELAYWLYGSREFMPRELVATMKTSPDYHNPWGVRVPEKRLKRSNYFRKEK